jgi:nitrite reductase/ring-hydroxylating ferredoxin subunit
MNNALYNWYKIADTMKDIVPGRNGLITVSVNGKDVCLSVQGDRVLACAAKCPHAGASLAEGYTDKLGNIVCPLHGYKFNLGNGRNVSGEGYFLVTYPVEQRADGIFVGLKP